MIPKLRTRSKKHTSCPTAEEYAALTSDDCTECKSRRIRAQQLVEECKLVRGCTDYRCTMDTP